MKTETGINCPRCGKELVEEDGNPKFEVCPRCLFGSVFDENVKTLIKTSPGETPGESTGGVSGTEFGNYVILGVLGTGGMGVVYRARQMGLERDVALKFLPAGEHASRNLVERFFQEARAAAALKHPNIVPIHEVSRHDGCYFYSMELVEGKTLGEAIANSGPGSRPLVEILAKVARAVHFAHEKKVIHRDIKPANIMVDSKGEPKILDFGIAKTHGTRSKETATGSAMGTPAYMSPEQVRGSKDLDARADVYSLGALLYEILTGRVPHEGASAMEVFEKLAMEDVVPPSGRNPKIARDLEVVCLKALEKDKYDRYGSAEELAEDLERYLRGEAIVASPPTAGQRIRRFFAKRGAVVLPMAMSILFGLGLVGGWGWNRWSNERSYQKARVEAEAAFQDGNWSGAENKANRAQEIREDGRMEEIGEKSRARMLAEEKMRPLEAMIRDTRPYFYIPKVNIRKKLDRVEKAIAELSGIMNRTANRDYGEGWKSLGMGYYFLSDQKRAEKALLEAKRLLPMDGQVNFYLGKIYLELSLITLKTRNLGEKERLNRAKKWSGLALQYMKRNTGTWKGATEMDVHVAQAYVALATGKDDEVRRLCKEGLEKWSDQVEGVEDYWTLLSVVSEGNDKGIRACSRALEVRPHYYLGYFMRANLQSFQENYDAAIQDYTSAIGLDPKRPDAYANRGAMYFGKKNFARAIQDSTKAISLDPTEAIAYMNRGNAFWKMGDLQRSIRDHTRAIQYAPENPVAYFNRGVVRLRNGDLEGAMRDFTEAIELNPKFVPGYNNRGVVHEKMGDKESAILDYNRSIALNPNNPSAFNNRGLIRKAMGDLDGAIEDFNRAIAVFPSHLNAFNNRGLVRKEMGDLDGAIGDYTKVISLSPGNATHYLKRGDVRMELEDLAGASEDYTKAIELDPESAPAYNRRGLLRMKSSDRNGAVADYTRAIELDPGFADSYNSRAYLRKIRRDFKAAIEDYTKVISLSPGTATHYRNRGDVRMELEDLAGAIEDYTKAIHLDPKYADAYKNRGVARFRNGDLESAIDDYTKAIELDRTDALTYINRGNARYKKKDLEGSIEDYTRAIELDPKFMPAYRQRGVTRFRTGDLEGAVADLNRALKISPSCCRSKIQVHLEKVKAAQKRIAAKR